jgi:hypothetical protein
VTPRVGGNGWWACVRGLPPELWGPAAFTSRGHDTPGRYGVSRHETTLRCIPIEFGGRSGGGPESGAACFLEGRVQNGRVEGLAEDDVCPFPVDEFPRQMNGVTSIRGGRPGERSQDGGAEEGKADEERCAVRTAQERTERCRDREHDSEHDGNDLERAKVGPRPTVRDQCHLDRIVGNGSTSHSCRGLTPSAAMRRPYVRREVCLAAPRISLK